ncbi:MAG: EamA family transporter [Candidatus Nanohaloarchaea archaeon]
MIGYIGLTLIAAVGFATANVVDKLVMTGHVDSPAVKIAWYGLLAPVAASPAFLLGTVGMPSVYVIGGAFVAAVCFLASLGLVMWAMRTGEVSRIALLKKTGPLFVLTLSILLLGDVLTTRQYLGVGVLFLAGMVATLDHPAEGLPSVAFNRPAMLILAGNLLYAFNLVTLKHLFRFADYWTVFYWQQIGMFLLAVGLLAVRGLIRGKVAAAARKPRTLGMLGLSSTVMVGASLVYAAAIDQVSPAIVSAINSINPLFTLVFVIGLQRLGIDRFEEHLTRTEIVAKTFATALFVAGIYLVN